MPTFGSLFAGIGGIDLGLERAGWECRFQVEWDPYCQHVLEHHWPDVPRVGDIATAHAESACPYGNANSEERSSVGTVPAGSHTDTGGSRCGPRHLPRVDLLAGGFPCQPFSNAGKRKGVEDERWLWPEFARLIGELRPRYVLVENVPGLLARHGGMGRVLGDLAELGYDAEWDCIPASAVGAPHLRYRVWIVAYANGLGRGRQAEVGSPRLPWLRPQEAGAEPHGAGDGAVADPDDCGWPRGTSISWREAFGREAAGGTGTGSGRRYVWLPEPDVGRVAHGVPARVDRLRSLGNAVVPQVVEVIGHQLLDAM